MRLILKKRWIVQPDGSKGLEITVANAATGEVLEGLQFVGVMTRIGAVEVLRVETSMFDIAPEETVSIVERVIEKAPEVPVAVPVVESPIAGP